MQTPNNSAKALLLSFVLIWAAGCASLESEVPQRPLATEDKVDLSAFPPQLLVADFNLPEWRTNLGGAFGGWDNDPGDSSHDCVVRLVEKPRLGAEGYTLQIEYDVDSPNPAFNGFWMKLPNIPTARYKNVGFALMGDENLGYTKRFKIELKGKGASASYEFNGGSTKWVRYHVPLSAFEGIDHVKTIQEIVIIFEKETVTESRGILYLDNLRFES